MAPSFLYSCLWLLVIQSLRGVEGLSNEESTFCHHFKAFFADTGMACNDANWANLSPYVKSVGGRVTYMYGQHTYFASCSSPSNIPLQEKLPPLELYDGLAYQFKLLAHLYVALNCRSHTIQSGRSPNAFSV